MNYYQTWNYWTKVRRWKIIGPWLYRVGQWICGKCIGHEPSKTEWGYGGGDFADVWCRWCNQPGRIAKEELMARFSESREIIWEATGCDIATQEWTPDNLNDL